MGHAGNELKANTAYTRASECLFVVGSLKMLSSSQVARRQGREEFVMESLLGLRERGAWKNFEAQVGPEEAVQGVVFEDDGGGEGRGSVCWRRGVQVLWWRWRRLRRRTGMCWWMG